MNASPLFTENKEDVVAYFCSECRNVAQNKELAEGCCKPSLCDCGVEIHKYSTTCDKCREASDLVMVIENLAKAKRVHAAAFEMVFSDETSRNDGFFELGDIEEVFEDSEMPFYVFKCKKECWAGLDAAEIIENEMDNGWFEGASDSVESYEELKTFLESWNEKQNLHQFCALSSEIVVLDEAKFEAMLSYKFDDNRAF